MAGAETLLCKFVFLDGSGGGKLLTITNRYRNMHNIDLHMYVNVTEYVLFINTLLGMPSTGSPTSFSYTMLLWDF